MKKNCYVCFIAALSILVGLVLPVELDSKANGQDDDTRTKMKTKTTMLPRIPVGLTSFGGAVADGSLFVFGGHCGNAHEYFKEGQNAKLYQLNLKSPTEWKVVDESSGLQGLAMVEHKGSLYRVGGFAALNEEGQEQDLRSVADFARFDSKTGKWKSLKPMPTSRSSLDSVVVDNTLFVAGGWTLGGNEKEPVWSENMVSIDLSNEEAEWKTIEVPFRRRALSTGFQGNKLYVIGGMQQKGGPTRKVSVFDLATEVWSDGPEIPGAEAMEGFGNSCFNIGGSLIVNTYSGGVFKLAGDGTSWSKINQLQTGRFFHRLLPYSDDQFLLVGGANMETGKIMDVQIHSAN